uniref:Uncharacterized protein n=1 Tax=Dulem virus 33 TaxID=3145751 RepID=A0AAU8B6P7_9CAUD
MLSAAVWSRWKTLNAMMNLNEREVNAEIAQREASDLNRTSLQELANLYVVRDHLFGGVDRYDIGYSMAPAPASRSYDEMVGDYGDSDFLQSVSGKDAAQAWAVIDELMDTLRVVNSRVYDSVLRKINDL